MKRLGQLGLNRAVFVGSSNACHDGHALSAVVGRTTVTGVAIGRTVPELAIGRSDDVFPLTTIGLRFFRLSEHVGHVGSAFEREAIPRLVEHADVDIFSPVGPVPAIFTGAVNDQAIAIELPNREIIAHVWIEIGDGFLIASVQVVSPEAVFADAGEHLLRQFFVPIARWNRREEGFARTLPVGEIVHAFSNETVRVGIESAKDLRELNHDVAPPSGAFAIGAIEECIAHVDVERALALAPQAVEKFLIA